MQPKVLIVDDSRDFAEYTGRRLRARGMAVSVVHSGQSAIRKAEREPFDVVLLDILMPGLDGIETLRELKKRDPQLQVVMLTGHGTEDTAEQGKSLGALDYLLKPVAFADLIGAIDRALEIRRGSNAGSPPDISGGDGAERVK